MSRPSSSKSQTATRKNSHFLDIFIHRPILAIVISLALVLIGLRSSLELPVMKFPRIESSSLVISTRYIGASADIIKGFITEPIERAASSVPGIDYIESTSLAGLSTVTLWLTLGEDSTDAMAELSAKLDQIRYELPSGAQDPSVSVERADSPHANFYLPVIANDMSLDEITDLLKRQVAPTLSAIKDVQKVELIGEREPAMRVWLNPIKMAAFQVSSGDIRNALLDNNVLSTMGRSENSAQQIDLLSNSTLSTVADFKNIVIRSDGQSLIRIGDVARVEIAETEGQYRTRMSHEETIFLGIYSIPGANEIAIGDSLYLALDELNSKLPANIRIDIGFDITLYMRDALREIFITLAETIFLVGLVVLVLMGSFRTALVPLAAIPISLLGAVGAMTLFGFSLNLLTVLAIVLSVGLVVDDAIVVVENVSRHMREGKSRIDAALASSRQLFNPIIGMTITLAAVYAPIGLLSGLTGALFKEFAITLAVAVLISGFVALTLSPIMSAYAAPEGGKEGAKTRWVNERFEYLQQAYGNVFDHFIHWRWQILAAGLFFALLTAPFYLFSQKELAPVEDASSVSIIAESAPEASLEFTNSAMKDVSTMLLNVPHTTSLWQVISPQAGFGGLKLVPPNERDVSPQQLLQPLFFQLAAIPALNVLPVLPPPLPTAGNFEVELVVTSTDSPANMKPYADQLVAAGYKSNRFMFLRTNLQIDLPQTQLIFKRDRIADLGMTSKDINDQLSIMLSGNFVNYFNLDGKAYQVIPMVEGSHRVDAAAIASLTIHTPSGELIPVSAIADIKSITSPRILSRFSQQNAFKVYGAVLPGTTKEQGLAALEKAAKELLPSRYHLDYSGESRQLRKEGNTLVGVLLLALVFVYFVLAVQFNSFRDPLVVLIGSVPLALAGAMIFPFLSLTSINIYSQIGFITLVGLIAKNGILIVEFANQLQRAGNSKYNAIKAASMSRLRPVIMTTAATVLGHFPLVLVSGAGAAARNSIGIILVAGMLVGTLFTLFVLPCVYLWLARNHGHDTP